MRHTVKLLLPLALLLAFVCCNDDFLRIDRSISDTNLKRDTEHPLLTISSVSETEPTVKHFPVLDSDVPAILESLIDKREVPKGKFSINSIKKNGTL